MVETRSSTLPLGTHAPDFSLPDANSDGVVSLSDFQEAKALLVMFICNHCPFVVHVRDELTRIAADYSERGLRIVAINSNSIKSHPQDGPKHMKELAARMHWDFPFLFDATQDVAKSYKAACTPEFFVFDGDQRLAYRGQLDDSRPSNGVPVSGHDLRAAIDSVLAGQPVAPQQKPSMGCNIKWAPGNEPDYFG
jgi:peroxiredoxin